MTQRDKQLKELLDAFKSMTLLELSQFVKDFETTFGVTATAPATVITQQPVTEVAPEPEEDLEFTVTLESAGNKKIQVIKEVRVLTKLGLKDAKDLVDSLPKVVLERVEKDAALTAAAALEGQGATVTVSWAAAVG